MWGAGEGAGAGGAGRPVGAGQLAKLLLVVVVARSVLSTAALDPQRPPRPLTPGAAGSESCWKHMARFTTQHVQSLWTASQPTPALLHSNRAPYHRPPARLGLTPSAAPQPAPCRHRQPAQATHSAPPLTSPRAWRVAGSGRAPRSGATALRAPGPPGQLTCWPLTPSARWKQPWQPGGCWAATAPG